MKEEEYLDLAGHVLNSSVVAIVKWKLGISKRPPHQINKYSAAYFQKVMRSVKRRHNIP